jgi:hypothetical protein
MTVLLREFIFHPAIFLADDRRCSTNRNRPTIVANTEYVVKVAFSFRLVRASPRISVKEVIHQYETSPIPEAIYTLCIQLLWSAYEADRAPQIQEVVSSQRRPQYGSHSKAAFGWIRPNSISGSCRAALIGSRQN